MAVPVPTPVCQFLSAGAVLNSGHVATGNVAVGTFVKVTVWGATAASTFTPTDSQGHTWHSLAQVGNVGGTALVLTQEFWTVLTTAWTSVGSDWLQVARTASNALGFFANSYGVGAVSAIGGTQATGFVTANNAAVTVSPSLTVAAGDLVEESIAWSTVTAGTVGSGYTKYLDAPTTSTNARRCAMQYQQFASGGTTNPAFTCGGTPQWAAVATRLIAAAPVPTWTVWNGSAEVPATEKVWNGTSEVTAVVSLAP